MYSAGLDAGVIIICMCGDHVCVITHDHIDGCRPNLASGDRLEVFKFQC